MKTQTTFLLAICLIAVIALSSCGNNSQLQAKVDELQKKVDQYELDQKQIAKELVLFDSLDFNFYSHQIWDSLSQSHADNIKVYYPDGAVTEGLKPQHIDALKPMFAFAPDTKITSHPIRFGSGDWTSVVGEMEGTFSRPMPIGGGKTIKPTGKKFYLKMCTVGHWKDGKMSEEYLFWDNQAFMKQIGLAQ